MFRMPEGFTSAALVPLQVAPRRRVRPSADRRGHDRRFFDEIRRKKLFDAERIGAAAERTEMSLHSLLVEPINVDQRTHSFERERADRRNVSSTGMEWNSIENGKIK